MCIYTKENDLYALWTHLREIGVSKKLFGNLFPFLLYFNLAM